MSLLDKTIQLGDINLSILPCGDASIFVFKSQGKTVVYAPCDVKPFTHDDLLYDADVLILGNTVIGEILKEGRVLAQDSFMRQDLFSMAEVAELKDKYRFKRVIMTHLEEDWGKSYDDYKIIEKGGLVEFAYDGMILEL